MSLSRLQALQDEMKKCFRCSLCKMVPLPTIRNQNFSDGCPAAREFHFHGYSGSGKSITALSLVEGRIEADQDLADIAFACTACGLCDVACKFIMEAERHQVNMALREHITEKGFGPAAHRTTIDNLRKCGHPNGEPPSSPGNWAEGFDLKIMPVQKAGILLFAGCMQRSDHSSAAATQKLAELLKLAGIDFGILGDDEPCCGLPAYWMGHRDVFEKTTNDVSRLIEDLGVGSIVIASGSCFGAFRSKYPEYGSKLKADVLHASQLLAQLVGDGRLKLTKPIKRKVTYHDPCYLGRQSEPPVEWEGEHKLTHGCMTYTDPPKPINRGVNGVYDEPRQILEAIKGIDFVEMHRVREYAFCCGGGGGVPEAYPELAAAAARHRIEEAADVGADLLVTACHRCRANLAGSQEPAAEGAMEIVDIIDLVHKAAGL
jgi:Fe-S oxidoreductase